MKIQNRLRSRRGESLTEVLVGLLIAALSITMMAGAITSSVNMIRSSSSRMQNYYEQNNRLEEQTTTPNGTTTLTIKGATDDDGLNPVSVKVNLYIHEQGNVKIISYKETTPSEETPSEETHAEGPSTEVTP